MWTESGIIVQAELLYFLTELTGEGETEGPHSKPRPRVEQMEDQAAASGMGRCGGGRELSGGHSELPKTRRDAH